MTDALQAGIGLPRTRCTSSHESGDHPQPAGLYDVQKVGTVAALVRQGRV